MPNFENKPSCSRSNFNEDVEATTKKNPASSSAGESDEEDEEIEDLPNLKTVTNTIAELTENSFVCVAFMYNKDTTNSIQKNL
ncbi:hypothetical protein FQR65_LT04035 [Abscondita terminalis]|nr:hypothetical protein FQR65_LT04035 [Abscondita terminalis]